MSMLGWTQEEIAKTTGITQKRVSEIIRSGEIAKMYNSISDWLSQGKTVEAAAAKLEIDATLAWAIYLWNTNEGQSHEVISENLGMSRQNVGFHCAIIKELAPDVLEIVEKSFATRNQENVAKEGESHVAENATRVAWQFSWFRHITPLPHRYQHHIVNRIIDHADKTTTKLVEGWSKLFKRRSVMATA